MDQWRFAEVTKSAKDAWFQGKVKERLRRSILVHGKRKQCIMDLQTAELVPTM